MASLTDIAEAYGAAGPAWARGPDRLYGRLAEGLVTACPPLAGRLALDVGAGTGALSRAIAAAGGEVVAVDLSVGMLAQHRAVRPPAVAADAMRLPFPPARFDATLAAFVLNHLPDPTAALREASRVTRGGGTVAASSFDASWTHPAKNAVEATAARFGYDPPDWYTALKSVDGPTAGKPQALLAAARVAGLAQPQVLRTTIDGGLRSPAAVAAWRLGMAHLAPFLAGLPPQTRQRLVAATIDAVGPRPPPVRPRVLILTAWVP